eukprot:TRINITY_DN38512_c0_g1_i1.p1 TRINITY_DN38512_c0_g1~~TRINITY_DN38512_c0_g1_i1.p1  ORF type:complete len:415 (+),score=94.58 TRINITY_DN38512_c0_g1_i1:101-1345(+)
MAAAGFLSSPLLAVEVTAASERATLQVHQAILDKMPYFEAQRERWSDSATGALQVKLPEDATVDDFACIMERAYADALSQPSRQMLPRALKRCQVASMLNCPDGIMDPCIKAVRSSISNFEEAEQVIRFAEAHEVHEVAKLAKRLNISAEPGFETIQAMYVKAAWSENVQMMKAVGEHLKAWSWKGGGGLNDVAKILCSDVRNSLAGMPIAFEFVRVHPSFFNEVTSNIFTKINASGVALMYDIQEEDAKYVQMFMLLCVEKYAAGDLKLHDLEQFFCTIAPRGRYLWRESLLRRALQKTACLADSFEKLDAPGQLAVCKVLLKMREDDFVAVCGNKGFFSTLVFEAKQLIATAAASFGWALRHLLNVDVIKIVGTPLVCNFMHRAHELDDDAMAILLALTRPASIDDSTEATF